MRSPRYVPNCRQQAKITEMILSATKMFIMVLVVFLVCMMVMMVKIVPSLNKRLAEYDSLKWPRVGGRGGGGGYN